MSTPDNPPAFPVKIERNTSSDPLATPREMQMEGMTLRDWFAGQAALPSIGLAEQISRESSPMPMAAKLAYEFADAMLAAREEK